MTPGPEKQFDRDQVLDRALGLFWQHGYAGTGMSQLLEHTGIGRQSLYNTFGDKKSLFLEALARYFRVNVAPIGAQLSAPGSPLGNIRNVLDAWIEMGRKASGCGCMVGNTIAELGADDPEIRRVIGGYFDTMETMFEQTLERARTEGELKTDLPSKDLARLMVNTVQGIALMSKVGPDFDRAKGVLNSLLALLEEP